MDYELRYCTIPMRHLHIRFLLPTLHMEAVVLCQMLVYFYHTKRRHISEGSNILSHRHENILFGIYRTAYAIQEHAVALR
jgi:hypothetical protein